MDVWARGTAAAAHLGDDLATFHRLPHLDQIFLAVAIAGREAIAVIDFNQIAITRTLARPRHHTGCHSDDVRAQLAGKIHAFVPRRASRERVGAFSKIGG